MLLGSATPMSLPEGKDFQHSSADQMPTKCQAAQSTLFPASPTLPALPKPPIEIGVGGCAPPQGPSKYISQELRLIHGAWLGWARPPSPCGLQLLSRVHFGICCRQYSKRHYYSKSQQKQKGTSSPAIPTPSSTVQYYCAILLHIAGKFILNWAQFCRHRQERDGLQEREGGGATQRGGGQSWRRGKSGIQEKVKGPVKAGVFIAVGNAYNCLLGEMKALESCPRLAEVESRLSKYTYLSRSNLPGYPDGIIFQMLNSSGSFPDRKRNPNFYHWYILMRQFAASTIQKWISDELYYDSEDTLPALFLAPDAPHDPPSPPAPPSPPLAPRSPTHPEYIIEILLKESSPHLLDLLLRSLAPYDLAVETQQERQIRINCRGSSAQYQEIADLVGRTIEFESLQVKKEKKMRPPQLDNSPTASRKQ